MHAVRWLPTLRVRLEQIQRKTKTTCSPRSLRPLQEQGVDAASAAAHADYPGAGLAAVAHLRDIQARNLKPRLVASTSATRQLRPTIIVSLIRAGDRPVYQFDDEIAAAEKHQPPPFPVRAVQRHVEAQSRAIEGGRTLGILGRDDDMVERRDRRFAVTAERGRSPLSSRKNIRTPRVSSVAARVRFQRNKAPEPTSWLSTSATGSGFSARRSSRRCILAMSRPESRCWQPLAPVADHGPNPVRGRPGPARRH